VLAPGRRRASSTSVRYFTGVHRKTPHEGDVSFPSQDYKDVLCAYFLIATSSFSGPSPNSTRKHNTKRSDSVRSIGFEKDLEFVARWLWEACRVLKLEGTP
jgi:hypothetical protein